MRDIGEEKRELLPYLIVLVLVVLAYGRTLGHTLLSDDYVLIERSRIASWEDLGRLFSPWGKTLYRPLTWATIALNYRLFGLSPLGWGLVSLCIHGANSCLVYALFRRLSHRSDLAWMAGLVFSVHFIHAEPAIWASGVNTLAMTFFFLISLVALESSSGRTPIPSLMAYLLALLCKETAITLPLVILLVERFKATPRYRRCLPFLGVAILYGIIRLPSLADPDPGSPYRWSVGLHGVKNLSFLLVALVFPLDFRRGLTIWNAFAASKDWSALLGSLTERPEFIAALIIVPTLFGLSLWRGSSVARLGVGWMAVTFLPFIFFEGTGERFLYLPSAGFCLALAGVVGNLMAKASKKARRWSMTVAMVIIVCFHLYHDHVRDSRWLKASQMAQQVIDGLKKGDFTPGSTIYLLDLPDNHRGAWIFRNGIPSLGRLIWGDGLRLAKIENVQKLPRAPSPGHVVLRFREGKLEQVVP